MEHSKISSLSDFLQKRSSHLEMKILPHRHTKSKSKGEHCSLKLECSPMPIAMDVLNWHAWRVDQENRGSEHVAWAEPSKGVPGFFGPILGWQRQCWSQRSIQWLHPSLLPTRATHGHGTVLFSTHTQSYVYWLSTSCTSGTKASYGRQIPT